MGRSRGLHFPAPFPTAGCTTFPAGPGQGPVRPSLWTGLAPLGTLRAQTWDLAPPATHPLNPAQVPGSSVSRLHGGSVVSICGSCSPSFQISWPRAGHTQHVMFLMVTEAEARCRGGVIRCRPVSLCWPPPPLPHPPACQGLCSSPPSGGSRQKDKGLLLALGRPGVSMRLSHWPPSPLPVLGAARGEEAGRNQLPDHTLLPLRYFPQLLPEFCASLFASDGRGHSAKDGWSPLG